MRHFYQRLYLLSIVLLLFATVSYAQTVSGVEVNIVGDDLQITYSMSGLRSGQKFDVELYSSIDNYSAPLVNELIVGDLGADISLKAGNMITIGDPLETLGAITGDLNFKIRTDLIYNPVSVTIPITFFKQKRGKKFTAAWSGGLDGEIVNFDVYKNNELILDNVYTAANTRSAEFKFPKVELGTGYSMKMQFESLNEDVAIPDFEVKRKKSIFGRVFTVVILAAAVDFYLYGSSSPDQFGLENSVRTEDFNSFFWHLIDPMGMTNNTLPPPPGPDQILERVPLITIPFN